MHCHNAFGAMCEPLELDGRRSLLNWQTHAGAKNDEDDGSLHDFLPNAFDRFTVFRKPILINHAVHWTWPKSIARHRPNCFADSLSHRLSLMDDAMTTPELLHCATGRQVVRQPACHRE
jgi:hypothetical protein